jgi:hypothetical protein
MKAIKCKIRLNGVYRDIITPEFDSIKEAKEWIRDRKKNYVSNWTRPYTIVFKKKRQGIKSLPNTNTHKTTVK